MPRSNSKPTAGGDAAASRKAPAPSRKPHQKSTEEQAHDPAPEKVDVYTRITNRIIADLENGVRPWMKPWSGDNAAPRIVRPLRHNGLPYSGINILMLWSEAADRGYHSPTWMSFKQATELGGHVRKNEKGTLVVYANEFTKKEINEQGEEEEQTIPFMKGYVVFNSEQIEGLPEQYYLKPEPIPTLPAVAEHIEAAHRFFEKTGAHIRHGGGHAFYSPHTDHIQMPPIEAFRDAESHAAVLAHELTHWTRHKSRLDRNLGRKQMGDEGYAREELVAELGSAFLCADLAITPETREDHAAYIANWLQVLKDDKRAIFSAASHAQRAVDYLHGLQKGQSPNAPGEASAQEPAQEPAEESASDVMQGRAESTRPPLKPKSFVERNAQERSLTLDLDFGIGRS